MRTNQLPPVPRRRKPVLTISNFSGGLNNRNSAIEIADNESPDLLNVTFSETGAVSKRNGTALVGDDKGAFAVNALFSVYYGNGSAQQLMVADSATANTDRLFYRTSGNWTELTSAGAPTAIVATDVDMETFTDASNQMVFITDGTTYQKYNPATNVLAAATASPATIGKILKLYKNRMYSVGSTANPERVYFSNLGDGDAWTVGDYFDVPSETTNQAGGSGDPITALAVFQGVLFIFKNRSIWSWDNTALRPVTFEHGCVGKRALCLAQNAIYFADNDGVYRFTGMECHKVSKKIQGTWDAIPGSLMPSIAMAYFNGRVFVGTGSASATTNDTILVNYIQLPPDNEGQQPWSLWRGTDTHPLSVSQFAVYEATTSTLPILTFGSHYADTIVRQLDTGTSDYNAQPIRSYWKSKIFSVVGRYGKQFVTYKTQSATSTLLNSVEIDFGAMPAISADYQMKLAGSATWSAPAWVTSTSYAVNDQVSNGGNGYICIVAHSSGTFATDLAAGKWRLLGAISAGLYGTAVYGGMVALIGKNNISTSGKYIQFKFENSQSGQPYTVYKLQQEFSPSQLR